MNVIPPGQPPSPGEPGRFIGQVEVRRLVTTATAAPGRPEVSAVSFHNGAVSGPHSHPGGQYLYVMHGPGRCALADDPEAASEYPAGTLVIAEPGEVHWHGAADAHDAEYLAVTWGGTEWQ